MGKQKSERHHWWPECVSARWADRDGGVHWLLPTGEVRRARPESFGVIRNGHFLKLGNFPDEQTPWDQNFELEFQRADDRFPAVIDWLESLKFESRIGQSRRNRFLPQPASDDEVGQMVESLTSLAIRSPMTRQACVSFAERFRGPLPERERDKLIAANLRGMHQRAVKTFVLHGKTTAIVSPDREFLFGDGFYHNLTSPSGAPYSPKILVPLTPRLAVLYARPMHYTVQPRLSTLVISADEAESLNRVVQIYARDKIFYRSDIPELTDEYRATKHLRLAAESDFIDEMIHSMPGVPGRKAGLDLLCFAGSQG